MNNGECKSSKGSNHSDYICTRLSNWSLYVTSMGKNGEFDIPGKELPFHVQVLSL